MKAGENFILLYGISAYEDLDTNYSVDILFIVSIYTFYFIQILIFEVPEDGHPSILEPLKFK